ncbi:MAG: hypothetical protein VYE15_07525 [Myxococcota bacterium]|nr:hypothetical protein [Myxococcota bacterium]
MSRICAAVVTETSPSYSRRMSRLTAHVPPVGIWICLLLLSMGCSRTPAGLVTAEDLEPAESFVAARVTHYQTLKCPRPVLRGVPLPGSAGAEIREAIEGTPDTDRCRRFLEENKGRVQDALALPAHGKETWEASAGGQGSRVFPKRINRSPTPIDRPEAEPSVLDEVAALCVPLVSRVRQAARREDGCSPYLPGRRSMPGNMVAVVDVARAVVATARTLARDGQQEEAASVLLDGLQFMYDVRRGGTDILAVGAAVAGSTLIAATFEAWLNSGTPLGRHLLNRVVGELTTLVEAAPHPQAWVEATGVSTALYLGEASLSGPQWAPPGGWGKDGRAHHGPVDLSGVSLDEPGPQGFQFLILAAAMGADDWATACPAEAPPLECIEGLRSLQARLTPDADLVQRWERRRLSWSSNEERRELLDTLVRGARHAPVAHILRHLPREGTLSLMVAGTRLAAALRAETEKTGRCPETETLNADSSLAPHLQDPYSGKPFRLVSHPEGWLVISSREPTFYDHRERPTKIQPAVALLCPEDKGRAAETPEAAP